MLTLADINDYLSLHIRQQIFNTCLKLESNNFPSREELKDIKLIDGLKIQYQLTNYDQITKQGDLIEVRLVFELKADMKLSDLSGVHFLRQDIINPAIKKKGLTSVAYSISK